MAWRNVLVVPLPECCSLVSRFPRPAKEHPYGKLSMPTGLRRGAKHYNFLFYHVKRLNEIHLQVVYQIVFMYTPIHVSMYSRLHEHVDTSRKDRMTTKEKTYII